ncbi:hypothetical protein C8Q70DRAFT_978107 [Cubamyces menziesii]|nr:hypothetical protein C8Q70DRAFT_978107 [Cubamyces menziesii]
MTRSRSTTPSPFCSPATPPAFLSSRHLDSTYSLPDLRYTAQTGPPCFKSPSKSHSFVPARVDVTVICTLSGSPCFPATAS